MVPIEFLLLSIIYFADRQVSALTSQQIEQINSIVDDYMTGNHVPGLSLAIVENNGEQSFAKGYGFSRIANNTPATNQTILSIGSITKSFTSAMVIQVLQERYPELGEHVLDLPIAQLAPSFNFTLSDRFRSEFTSFRDLLSHRTCLANTDFPWQLGMATNQEYEYRTRYLSEACPFRSGYAYNNHVYSLAGNIIAHIANTTYSKLAEDFFEKLGMVDSILADEAGNHEQLPYLSHAYFRRQNETFQFNTTHLRRLGIVGGAGAILSTSSDMVQYLKFHLGKGKVDNMQILPEEALSWMYKAAIPIPSDTVLGLTGGSGLGLGLAVYKGNPLINHGAHFAPYESFLGLFPVQGVGIFVATNGPGITGTYPGQMSKLELLVIIFEIIQGNSAGLKGLSRSDIQSTFLQHGKLGQADQALKLVLRQNEYMQKKLRSCVQLEDIIGKYGNPETGDVSITIGSNQIPFIYFGNWGYGNLQRLNDTIFSIEWTSPIMDDFYSYGNVEMPTFEIDFSIEGQFLFVISGDPIPFYKDRVIDTLPSIPWDPNSCGPSALFLQSSE